LLGGQFVTQEIHALLPKFHRHGSS